MNLIKKVSKHRGKKHTEELRGGARKFVCADCRELFLLAKNLSVKPKKVEEGFNKSF